MPRTRVAASILAGLVLTLWGTGGPAAVGAQDATPLASPPAMEAVELTLIDQSGQEVGSALLSEGVEDGVSVFVDVDPGVLAPGEHGIHIHGTGVCDPGGDQPFASAGGHYNPTDAEHGQHAGDLGNIAAEEDGTATFRAATEDFGLEELEDEDGSAIVIHAEEDENDPAGESFGARIACGVLAAPAGEETPAAGAAEEETPEAGDDETPAA